MEIIATLYFLSFLLCGYSIARIALNKESFSIRLWFGGVIGLFIFIWLPAGLAFVFDFSLNVQYAALLIAIILGMFFLFFGKKRSININPEAGIELSSILVLLPLILIGIILHSTHTIRQSGDALYVGQSTYGDLAMHLGFITSISVQKTFPPMYSICPDTPVGYPFLCDSVSSTLYTITGNLRFSALLPAAFSYILVVAGVYFFFRKWLKDNKKAIFALYLFFIGGGFGFAYFFDMLKQNPDNFSRIFRAFYETPTNYVNSGIKWVNPIADMLVPQRATLFGWAFLFPCLYLLIELFEHHCNRSAILLGIIAGGLPLIHTHSFLALGIISGCYVIIDIIKFRNMKILVPYAIYLFTVIVFAAPQLIGFTFRQSNSFLHLHYNWANFYDNPIWFSLKNLGLFAVFALPAFFDTESRNRELFSGAVLIWILAETIQFQPNSYDNNKLLFVSFAFLCGLVSDYLIRIYSRLKQSDVQSAIGTQVLAGIVCTALFTSGILTLGREYVSQYELFSAQEVSAAEFIKNNTAPHSTFLTHNNHNNSVAALTGRNIVCGTGSYLYFHGIDYQDRENSLKPLYETPEPLFDEFKEVYGIDFIYIGSNERWNYNIDYDYFNQTFKCVYDKDGVTIYDVNQVL